MTIRRPRRRWRVFAARRRRRRLSAHANIVGVFDYGEINDIAYIVIEYVDGPSVKSLVDKQERFALADTMRIMTDLLTGLQFSHGRGVVHRDIKPANVMLTSDGQGKIADFGIARIESSSMTQAGTVLGTPAYMSPEQFMGQVVDARTDIYSSGVVLYQLLTGERPFEGGMSAIMHKALNTDPPLPSQITVTCPAAFDAVVRKAMAKRPEDRFQSADDFLEALQAAVAGKPLPGLPPTLPVEDEADGEATLVARRSPSIGDDCRRRSARRHAGRAAPPQLLRHRLPPAAKSNLPIIAIAAVVVLALLGGGVWFLCVAAARPGRPGRSPRSRRTRRRRSARPHPRPLGRPGRPRCSRRPLRRRPLPAQPVAQAPAAATPPAAPQQQVAIVEPERYGSRLRSWPRPAVRVG